MQLCYIWRSLSILSGVSANPIDARDIDANGVLNGSPNFEAANSRTLSFNASAILCKFLQHCAGKPGADQRGPEGRHFANGAALATGAAQ